MGFKSVNTYSLGLDRALQVVPESLMPMRSLAVGSCGDLSDLKFCEFVLL